MAQGLRPVDTHDLKTQGLGRLRLAELPEGRRRYCVWVDEPAHARPVVDEDDRGLTGKIDGADGITLVDDVGGLFREGPIWSLKPKARAVALRRELPIGGEKTLVPGLVDPIVVGSGHDF